MCEVKTSSADGQYLLWEEGRHGGHTGGHSEVDQSHQPEHDSAVTRHLTAGEAETRSTVSGAAGCEHFTAGWPQGAGSELFQPAPCYSGHWVFMSVEHTLSWKKAYLIS